MGEPFTGFVQKKRLEAGARLLRETDLSIEEIIKRVGYDNASFFRRLFKKKYGTMPLQYRKGRVK
jgi:AraC-like DNA-binding protein